MFSVVVPLYNKSFYIEKCLQSIIEQTFLAFEVIVVNDGSTDDGLERVIQFIEQSRSHSKSEIKLINQINSGVSVARNKGVKEAKYDFIAFLDADDWWEPFYLEGMKSLIEDYPEAGIYGSNYYLLKNGRKQLSTIGVEKDFKKGIINYCQVYAKTLCMPLWTGATVIRKAIFESFTGFKHELKFGEDFDLWIRVALKYDVAFLNKPLAIYNQDVESKSRAIGKLHKPDHHMLWNLEYLAGEESINPDYKHLIDNLRIYSLLPYYLNKNYHDLAIKELKKVDWSKQSASARRTYETPFFILKMINHIQYVGSRIKQFIISKFILSIKN